MSGTPLPEVSAMLGHANVNITLTIAHYLYSLRHEDADGLGIDARSSNFQQSKAVDDQVDHLRDTSEEKAAVC